MEVREFYGAETLDFYKLCALLFHSPISDGELTSKAENDKKYKDFSRFGAFENGFLSAIEIRPFSVRFNGHNIKMGGIGAVVSSQQARGKGTMKLLFNAAFEKMRENGQILSHLYPFRGDYYRKFGYEPSAYTRVWHIPTEYLRTARNGRTVPYDGSESMKTDIKNIYRLFVRDKNLALSEKSDAFYESVKPYSSGSFAYIHYNESSEADGFLCYHMKQNPDRRQDIEVENFWYLNKDAISGLLSYFASLKDYSDSCIIPCNDDLAPFIEFNGGWGKRDSFFETRFNGSSRIIDAEKMLSLTGFEGKVSVKLNDLLCPWNNDVFTVADGAVSRGGDPDAIADIGIFSAMLLGRCENPALIPGFKILKNETGLKQLLKPKNMWFDEHF